jgi:hypothetical protein
MTKLRVDNKELWLYFLQAQEIYLFYVVSMPAVDPTQPHTQRLSGDLSLGVKRPGLEADDSPPYRTNAKNYWNYTFTVPYAFIVVVCIRTTLSLPLRAFQT